MRLYFLLFLPLFFSFGSIGQNLITNGDFEISKSDSLFGWEDLASSPDYLNLKEPSNTSNWLLKGYSQKNQGNDGFMGILMSNNASEAFQQKLKHKLVKGSYYKLSCDVLATNLCMTGFETVTMALSRDRLIGSEGSKNYDIQCFNLKPTGGFINHGEWTTCTIIFKSNGNEHFLSIGNFNLENSKYTKSIAETQELGLESACNCIIYDNIRLEEFDKESIIQATSPKMHQPKKIILEDVLFESGSAALKMNFQYKLDSIYKMIKHPMQKIRIIGYTDNVGSLNDNKILSKNRADSVKSYLVHKGYDADMIVTKGLHESHPIMSNETETGRGRNRRVEILLN